MSLGRSKKRLDHTCPAHMQGICREQPRSLDSGQGALSPLWPWQCSTSAPWARGTVAQDVHCVHRSWEARHQAVHPPESYILPLLNHPSYCLAHTASFPTIFNGAKARKGPEGSPFGLPGCRTVGRPGRVVGERKKERAGWVLAVLPGTERHLRSKKTSGLSLFGLLSQRKDGLC